MQPFDTALGAQGRDEGAYIMNGSRSDLDYA